MAALDQQKIALIDLFEGVSCETPVPDVFIKELRLDSRLVSEGDVFLACPGVSVDGRDYIEQAQKLGAEVIVCEAQQLTEQHKQSLKNCQYVLIENLQHNISVIAANYFLNPSKELIVVGITGTNGKTSCSHFLAQALSFMNEKCYVSGTLGVGLMGSLIYNHHTTPDPIAVQKMLFDANQLDVFAVAMEVSSHGLQQGRVSGVNFDTAVFTNISRDHLDYHGSMDSYQRAKQQLFLSPNLKSAVINIDDVYSSELIDGLASSVELCSYSVSNVDADVYAKNVILNKQGIRATVVTPWGEIFVQAKILGEFNLSNILAVISVLGLKGFELNHISDAVAHVKTVPGRMEVLGGQDGLPLVVVDFAHTPDALAVVLKTLRSHCSGKLWTVFGCGGNRDQGKRKLMAEAVSGCSDHVVVTDDNPRSEDPEFIVDQIVEGIKDKNVLSVIHDRGKAISFSIMTADVDDVVLIAGKGHENYQEIGSEKFPFNDIHKAQLVLNEKLSGLGSKH